MNRGLGLMGPESLTRSILSTWIHKIAPAVAGLLTAAISVVNPASGADLKVMKMGLGSGTIASTTPGIDCGDDCNETYGSSVSVTLTATEAAGSKFSKWDGDCSDTSTNTCVLTMSVDRSVRAVFDLDPAIPSLTGFKPEDIQKYLTENATVNTAARFVSALPREYKQNWIMMSRSESLQTGIAEFPRLLLPSANAQSVFTLGLATHGSYPGSHPNAIEYMQWDAREKNFRFHEIVVDTIPDMAGLPARGRGVSIDDAKCSKCHSTQNVLNRSAFPGTTGDPPGTLKAKNKPNWDAYDSWGGMMPLNRDRIYQGSVEAAAFRKMFNPWTWRTNDPVRSMMEQLELQPPGVLEHDVITRVNGGKHDGHIKFDRMDGPSSPVLTEPTPSGPEQITTSYSFNRVEGTGPGTSVTRGGDFVTLRHSDIPSTNTGEGRGVRLFDVLGGLAGDLNQQRIADELINHRFGTGNVDVRPIVLAIAKLAEDGLGCIRISGGL